MKKVSDRRDHEGVEERKFGLFSCAAFVSMYECAHYRCTQVFPGAGASCLQALLRTKKMRCWNILFADRETESCLRLVVISGRSLIIKLTAEHPGCNAI